ncbi:MAG: hypothetical protein ABEI27_12190 [Halobellus sp.]|uniref:hypothetical protein n=1 Tax=Halobellus sp. TaxID=1979212 RepID=UPI0035D491E3
MIDDSRLSRRALLAALGSVGTASVAGCSFTQRERDGETTAAGESLARELAERFAPTLYFDAAESWFPTDPRPYASEQDGETVVDGFDALDGYHERYDPATKPPNPTVFYNAVEYENSPLAVVQFWLYSAFDQFTTNFHWHDWEALHVFVDTDTGEPQLFVASSHSRKVPNNEFLDPDPETVPRLLAELGSHSSALSINDQFDAFQRLPSPDLLADITNSAITSFQDISELPLAYGLPRDERARLPYLVPAYEGAPIYEHERLPNVDRESLLPPSLTIRSFDSLSSPPGDLPARATGIIFRHGGQADGNTGSEGDETASEHAYDLVPTSEIENIVDFTGPQLSYEFAVPEYAEDGVASHITTTGAPWGQPRYENPAADITDPNHRSALADRYDAIGGAAPINTVVSRVTEAVTTDDAPEDEGLTTQETNVEAVALIESDPEAIPTFRGVVVARDVATGEHRLTVNGAGRAPHSERIAVGEGATSTPTTADETDGETTTARDATVSPESPAMTTQSTAAGTDTTAGETSPADETARQTPGERITVGGVDGEIPLVARENARKLEVNADGTDAELTDLAVADDFAGRLYESPLAGSDAVYVHRGGAYTTEVRDADGAIGAFRVNPGPDDDSRLRIERPDTGKTSLAEFLVSITAETQEELQNLVDDDAESVTDGGGRANALRGLLTALSAILEAAKRAAENARNGDRAGTDQQLQAVEQALGRVAEEIEAASGDVPDPLQNAARNRVEEAGQRAVQAQRLTKL